MNINIKYFEDIKKCFLVKEEEYDAADHVRLEEMKAAVIDLENKEVANLHSFFQKIIIERVLTDDITDVQLDRTTIEGQDFYGEESFTKLLILIESIIVTVNIGISSFDADVPVVKPEEVGE